MERAVDLLYQGRIDYGAIAPSRYELAEWEAAFANPRACKHIKALVYPNGMDWGAR